MGDDLTPQTIQKEVKTGLISRESNHIGNWLFISTECMIYILLFLFLITRSVSHVR